MEKKKKEEPEEPMCPLYDKCFLPGSSCKAGVEEECGIFIRVKEVKDIMDELVERIRKTLQEKGEFSCDEEWYKNLHDGIRKLLTKNIKQIIQEKDLYHLEDEIVFNFLENKKKGGRGNEPF